jgi:general secretion pathway protein D
LTVGEFADELFLSHHQDMKHMIKRTSPALLLCGLLSGCVSTTLPGSMAHVTDAPRVAGTIPELAQAAPLPAPKAAPQVQTYSVSVTGVPVQSVLFALARDAGMNIDIHPGIEGQVTLNAIDQTLAQLLQRISRQVDMRYKIDQGTLIVEQDSPEWRNYKIDYVNMARSTTSAINIATQISTTGGGPQQSYAAPASGQPGTIQSPSPSQQSGGG